MNDDGDDDFGLWQQQGDQAMFNINGATDKAFNRANGGIGPGETEEVYVQFKVKNDALVFVAFEKYSQQRKKICP